MRSGLLQLGLLGALMFSACLHAAERRHTVKASETLSDISTQYGVDLGDLVERNELQEPDFIFRGQVLIIPDPKSESPPPDSPSPGMIAGPAKEITVQKKQTLTDIAQLTGVSVEDLVKANGLKDPNNLYAGQKLVVPGYVEIEVQHKETLSDIAGRYGMSPTDIAAFNELRQPDLIHPGQTLRIPGLAAFSGKLASVRPSVANPVRTLRVTVRKNQTLSDIAGRYGVSESVLVRVNKLNNPNRIYAGQKLVIPSDGTVPEDPLLPSGLVTRLGRISVNTRTWRYIIIHHSATKEGSAKNMDRYHKEQRHMENGLAYHFVIGNGNGMGNGEIAIGGRWTSQLPGGHLAIESLNRQCIGICLVGNFQNSKPTSSQMDSLEGLIEYLMKRCRIPESRVMGHTHIHKRHTLCPGKYFPLETLKARLD